MPGLAEPLSALTPTEAYHLRTIIEELARPEARDPKLAADFVAATMDGYRWAIENHEQALEMFVKANPEVDRDAARLGLLVAIDGLLTPAGREHGLGAMDPERMAFQIDMLAKLNSFPRPAADEICTNQFIRKVPVTVPAALQAELAKMP